MKKLSLVTLILICCMVSVFSQSCLPEGIIFSSQADIDNFQSNYPGCTSIEGSVEINSYYIHNLNGLSVLDSVLGDLRIISSYILVDLSDLENLQYIGGNLIISDADYLENLEGLENITSIDGELSVTGNYRLTSMAGLNNLGEIGGNLNIGENRLLPDFSGLELLDTIGGAITIRDNWMLSSLSGMDNISAGSITDLTISGNSQLSSCEVQSICNYLASPNGIVEIYDNSPGCNSPGEIANACGFAMPCLPSGNYYFTYQAEIDNFHI